MHTRAHNNNSLGNCFNLHEKKLFWLLNFQTDLKTFELMLWNLLIYHYFQNISDMENSVYYFYILTRKINCELVNQNFHNCTKFKTTHSLVYCWFITYKMFVIFATCDHWLGIDLLFRIKKSYFKILRSCGLSFYQQCTFSNC